MIAGGDTNVNNYHLQFYETTLAAMVAHVNTA